MKFVVEQAAYHRNGMSGEGFYVGTALVDYEEDGNAERFVVTFFPETDANGETCKAGKGPKGEFVNPRIAVVLVSDLVAGPAKKIGGMRGDNFLPVADAIVKRVDDDFEETMRSLRRKNEAGKLVPLTKNQTKHARRMLRQ